MTPENVRAIFRTFQKIEPHPKTELTYTNPFTLLMAIVLAAQATDAGVNKATLALFKAADTPKKLLALGEQRLRTYVSTIGLYRSKAKYLIALAQMLIKDFGGKIPETRDALMLLPGVGRKTANVWLNAILGHKTIGVDTHVFRVSNRLGLAHSTNVQKVEESLERAVPEKYKSHAHHWLVLHGRYLCKARVPECWRCPVIRWCEYPDKNLAPPKPAKLARSRRQ